MPHASRPPSSTPCSAGASSRWAAWADVVTKNRVVDNGSDRDRWLAPNPRLGENVYPSTDNQVTDNVVHGSGLADLAALLPTADDRNCSRATPS